MRILILDLTGWAPFALDGQPDGVFEHNGQICMQGCTGLRQWEAGGIAKAFRWRQRSGCRPYTGMGGCCGHGFTGVGGKSSAHLEQRLLRKWHQMSGEISTNGSGPKSARAGE